MQTAAAALLSSFCCRHLPPHLGHSSSPFPAPGRFRIVCIVIVCRCRSCSCSCAGSYCGPLAAFLGENMTLVTIVVVVVVIVIVLRLVLCALLRFYTNILMAGRELGAPRSVLCIYILGQDAGHTQDMAYTHTSPGECPPPPASSRQSAPKIVC